MAHEIGLRERKKRQTRLALIDAALDLFLRQGYEQTTIDQITEAVEVSQRTFFRYFAGKEDLLAYYTGTAEEILVAALAARPADEPPFVAAAEAFRAFFRYLGEASPEERERFDRARRVLEAEPTLLWVHFTHMGEIEQRLGAIMAERMGVDPAVDPRPRIVVAMIGGAVRVGFTGPSCDDAVSPAVTSVVRQVEQALALAEEMLDPAWHTYAPGTARAGARLT